MRSVCANYNIPLNTLDGNFSGNLSTGAKHREPSQPITWLILTKHNYDKQQHKSYTTMQKQLP